MNASSMAGRFYPNLEIAQSKSSLKYRVVAPPRDRGFTFEGRPSSPDRDASGNPPSSPPPSRRQHRVPSLAEAPATTQLDGIQEIDTRVPPRSSCKTTTGKRRRREELSPAKSSDPHTIHRSASMTSHHSSAQDSVASRTASGGVGRIHVAGDDDAPPIPASLSKKLDAINHIIAKAEEHDGPTITHPAESRWRTLLADDAEILFDTLDSPQQQGPRSTHSKKLEPLQDTSAESKPNAPALTPIEGTLSRLAPQSSRKLMFLLNQTGPDNPRSSQRSLNSPTSTSRHGQTTVSPTLISPSRTASSKYMITQATEPLADTSTMKPVSKQASLRQLNDARVMEFVDDANMNPRRASTVSLDKQLRRISLVSFEQGGSEAKLLQRNDSSIVLRRKQMFGIYSIREVMAVIRLFWFLDIDRSGDITLDELVLHRKFFVQLGRGDLGAVFRELDIDGNGTVSLSELLGVCFRHATDQQLQAMLTLAKVGNLREYLTGHHHTAHKDTGTTDTVSDHARGEFQAIFRIFDRNGDGHINRNELFEALEIDDEMFSPALETSRENWAENARRIERAKAGGLTKEDIERFYGEYDKNNDDMLDFDEFVRLMEAAAHGDTG